MHKLKGEFASAKDLVARAFRTWAPPQFAGMPEIQYIEKNLKVATEDDPPLIVPFRLNPVQRVYHAKKEAIESPRTSGKRILTLKSRRMGITTYEQGVSYAKVKTQTGARCVTVAQSEDAVTTIFEMVKLFHKEDPNFVKPSRDNETTLAYASLRSKFSVSTANGTAVKRGDTLHRVHGSEVAFWDHNERSAQNLIASLDKAANRGEMILESTANGPSGLFYDLWTEAQSKKDRWRGIFLGWYLDSRNSIPISNLEFDRIMDTLTADELQLVDQFSCNANQLAWRREQMGSTETSREIFKQEYPAVPEEAFIATGNSCFNQKIIDQLALACKEPVEDDGNGFQIWVMPVPGHKYCIGVDTSEGLDTSDDCPIAVLDYESGEQVARWNGKLAPHELGRLSVKIAVMYNHALLAIEMNNTGHSVLNTVINQMEYSNVYYHEDDIKLDASESKSPGWRTTPLTRPVMISELVEAVDNRYMKVNDKLFLGQCRVFRSNASGKQEVSRKNGNHGDIVIAWAIAWQARKSKRNFVMEITVV